MAFRMLWLIVAGYTYKLWKMRQVKKGIEDKIGVWVDSVK